MTDDDIRQLQIMMRTELVQALAPFGASLTRFERSMGDRVYDLGNELSGLLSELRREMVTMAEKVDVVSDKVDQSRAHMADVSRAVVRDRTLHEGRLDVIEARLAALEALATAKR